MKLTCKTLKGQHFDIQVESDAKIQDVKKAIEEAKGKDFPAAQLKLIHQGKVLKDDNSSLEDNSVSEKSFVVVMVVQPPKGAQASSSGAASSQPAAAPAAAAAPAPAAEPAPVPAPAPAPAVAAAEAAPQPSSEAAPSPAPAAAAAAAATEGTEEYVEASAASTLLAGSQLEQTVSQILEMGGGGWDRPTVLRALRAAFNNPERAIEYLYTGIPETAELPPPVSRETAAAGAPATGAAPAAPVPAAAGGPNPGVPNVTPFNLFGGQQPGTGAAAAGGQAGALDFLRTNPQFQGLRAMVQTNPGLLQPMLQELGKANPELARLISTHQAEFLRLLNEPPSEGDLLQLAAAAAQGQGQPPPVALNVTPEESEAINRLEAMGFDRQLVIEAFFACDKNEQLAANYLLEHGAEFDD